VSKELLQLVEFLAENTHDTWAANKINHGWVYGSPKNREAKTHPTLKPYSELSLEEKEKTRNGAYKILGTLIEWGYTIVKKEDDEKEKEKEASKDTKKDAKASDGKTGTGPDDFDDESAVAGAPSSGTNTETLRSPPPAARKLPVFEED